MYTIDFSSIKEENVKELVNKLTKLHTFDPLIYLTVEEYLDDMLGDNCEVVGLDWEPFVPEEGPSYSSGGQPSEGGYFNAVDISVNGVELIDYLTEDTIDMVVEDLSEIKMNKE